MVRTQTRIGEGALTTQFVGLFSFFHQSCPVLSVENIVNVVTIADRSPATPMKSLAALASRGRVGICSTGNKMSPTAHNHAFRVVRKWSKFNALLSVLVEVVEPASVGVAFHVLEDR